MALILLGQAVGETGAEIASVGLSLGLSALIHS